MESNATLPKPDLRDEDATRYMDIRISNSVIVLSVSVVISVVIVVSVALAPFEWAKLVWRILSYFFSKLTRHYAAASVQGDATKLVNRRLVRKLSDVHDVQFRVDWVEKPSDARLLQDGRVIVRMRRERDQARNVLAAVGTALPHILFPHLRPYAERRFTAAVDLQLLRLLVEVLGDLAQTTYATDYLEPQTRADPHLHDLLRLFHQINAGGLFETVLLQELVYLSDRARNDPLKVAALRQELVEFVRFVHWIATREPHDESRDLTFVRTYIKVGFILTAKFITAAKGTGPYERRLSIHLAQGVNSIYLYGLTPDQHPFCRELTRIFDGDDRVLLKKALTVPVVRGGRTLRLPLAHFRRNPLAALTAQDFTAQLATVGIAAGSVVEGRVRQIREHDAEIVVEELPGLIDARNLAWGYRGTAARYLREGDVREFGVLSVDAEHGLLVLGRKQLTGSPWQVDAGRYSEGKKCTVEIVERAPGFFVVKIIDPAPSGGTEVFGVLPFEEWSWFKSPDADEPNAQPGSHLEATIVHANAEHDELALSRRTLESKDWERLVPKYAKGTSVRVRVIRVEYSGIYCELEPGAYGWIQRANIIKGGHELEDFERTVVPGAQFDAIVVGIKLVRRYFQLELKRLIGAPLSPPTPLPPRHRR